MKVDRAFWKSNAHKSGEQLARDFGGDGGTWRRKKRKAAESHPELFGGSAAATTPLRGIASQSVAPSGRKKVGVERCLVVGDIHVPFHDPRAVNVSLALAEDMQPETLIFNGDIADFYAISRYSKDPERALMLQDELDATRDVLAAYRKVLPRARLIYVEGNHEARLRAFLVNRAPELSKLNALGIESLLGLKELGIEYVPSKGRSAHFRYGAISVGHFDKVNKHSAYTEKALVDQRHESLVQGHTHRLGEYYLTLPGNRMLAGIGSGCLCDLNPEYCDEPNWQHGLVVITKRKDTDRFHVQSVPVVDYEAIYNDTLYSG